MSCVPNTPSICFPRLFPCDASPKNPVSTMSPFDLLPFSVIVPFARRHIFQSQFPSSTPPFLLFDVAFGFSFFSFLYHRLIFAIILRQIPCSCFSQFFPSASDFCLFIFRCFAARFLLIPLPRVSSLVFASIAATSSRIPQSFSSANSGKSNTGDNWPAGDL